MSKHPPIKVCFEAHAKDGLIWSVQVGRQPWRSFRSVAFCGVAGQTRYRGPSAPQPRAYLVFVNAKVEAMLDTAAILPAEGPWSYALVTDSLVREMEG